MLAQIIRPRPESGDGDGRARVGRRFGLGVSPKEPAVRGTAARADSARSRARISFGPARRGERDRQAARRGQAAAAQMAGDR